MNGTQTELPGDLAKRLNRILSGQGNELTLGLPTGTEMAALAVDPRPFASPESLLQALQALGPLSGWWEFSDELIVRAQPGPVPLKPYLLSADLWNGRGTGYAVRPAADGWVLNALTKGPSTVAVVVTHHRLARKDANVDVGGLRLRFEVCWRQQCLPEASDVAGEAVGFPRLVPFVTRFAGFE